MIWTVLTVTDPVTGHTVYRMDIDGAGPDEEAWLYQAARRSGRAFAHDTDIYTFTTENRPDDSSATSKKEVS